MAQTIAFAANSFSNAIMDIKSAALETIKDAIKNGIGGQDYCWYTDSHCQDWVVRLSKGDLRDHAGSMTCFKRPASPERVTKDWEPDEKVLKWTFDLDELCRMADQCTQESIKCYKAQLWVNGWVEQTEFYDSCRQAEDNFKATVDVKAYDKVEVKVEPVMASIIECEAYKAYRRDQRIRLEMASIPRGVKLA